jgi:hypothetical protein
MIVSSLDIGKHTIYMQNKAKLIAMADVAEPSQVQEIMHMLFTRSAWHSHVS